MKRPSFQFYPADWRSNAKLRRCSEAARGAWMDVLCVLHDSDEYGVVRYPLAELARAAGVPLRLLKELAEKGVLKGGDKDAEAFTWAPFHAGKHGPETVLLPASDGPAWYCSRFVRDEHVRQRRGASTRFDADTNPAPNHPPKPAIGEGSGYGASSSSSSTSSRAELLGEPIDLESARTPALVGQFEGHPDPKPAPTNPLAPIAIALRRAGFPCTTNNPDLIAYAAEGGTLEHALQVAEHPDCAGKAATYVLRFARRELAQPAAPVATGPPRNGTASKTMQAIRTLEAMKSDEHRQPEPRLALGHDSDRAAEAVAALARSISRR